MTGAQACGKGGTGRPGDHPARSALESLAFILLLMCLTARPFIGGSAYRMMPVRSVLKTATRLTDDAADKEVRQTLVADCTESARVTFAMVIGLACVLWLAGGALNRRLTVRGGVLAAGIILFAAASLISTLTAGDKRTALDSWLEQVTLLAAAFLAMQLCADRKRLAVMVIVLAGLAGLMAASGLWEYFVEKPEQIAEFDEDPAAQLRRAGRAQGTPEAKAFAFRARDRSVTGRGGLANPLASMLIVLAGAAAGLAADKLAAAFSDWRQWRRRRGAGEIHTPMLAAGLSIVVTAAVVLVLALTFSRGGIAVAAAVAAAGVGVYRFRRRLARRWRQNVLIAACLSAVAVMGVVSVGVMRDGLPSTTMTYRWHYWTGGAKVIAERPLLGVGGGNFSTAYLQRRRAGAEEEVKSPHNVMVHALAQYGLVGGLCYLAILFGSLVALCRPRGSDRPDQAQRPAGKPPSVVVVAAAVALGAAATRIAFPASRATSDAFWAYLLVEAVAPALVLALMVAIAAWAGRHFSAGWAAPGRRTRIMLACGAGGFVLHNMITFSLWAPAPAMVFWCAIGAGLACAAVGGQVTLRRGAWIPLLVAGAAPAAAGAILWRPVLIRRGLADQAAAAVRRQDYRLAADCAVKAAQADPLDPIAAADAAWALELVGDAAAETWAREAAERDPENSAHFRLAAQLRYRRINSGRDVPVLDFDTLWYLKHSIVLNPNDLRARLDYAEKLCAGRFYRDGLAELRHVEHIAAMLVRYTPADSPSRLTPAERRKIAELKANCGG